MEQSPYTVVGSYTITAIVTINVVKFDVGTTSTATTRARVGQCWQRAHGHRDRQWQFGIDVTC